MTKPSCRACAHSYMEPDGPARLICGHVTAGPFGKYVTSPTGKPQPIETCNLTLPPTEEPHLVFFQQHPGRTASGDLK